MSAYADNHVPKARYRPRLLYEQRRVATAVIRYRSGSRDGPDRPFDCRQAARVDTTLGRRSIVRRQAIKFLQAAGMLIFAKSENSSPANTVMSAIEKWSPAT